MRVLWLAACIIVDQGAPAPDADTAPGGGDAPPRGSTSDSGSRLARDTGSASVYPAGPGDVILNEIMVDPVGGDLGACNDPVGEWVELLNVSGHTLQLGGLVLKDDFAITTDSGTVLPAIVLGPGAVVVGRNAAGDCHGLPTGFSTDFSLNNGGDRLRLETADGALVDEVDLRYGWPDATGASIQLAPTRADPFANDLPVHWCVSTREIGGGPDRGTPGEPNDPC